MRRRLFGCAGVLFLLSFGTVHAAEAPASPDADAGAYAKAVDRAIDFLQTKAQATDGSYAAYAGPGATAVVTAAVLRHGRSPQDPLVAKGLKYLEGFVQPDGAISLKASLYRNYETSLALVCFAEANRDGRYEKLIENAERFLKADQWTENQGLDKSSPSFGGAGYGKHKRPDLSNTQFLIDALRAAGAGPDDEAMQKALAFVSRCQNLESEHNTLSFPAKNPDGGFYYTPAAGGQSQAGETPSGGLRSYGSMTYAGLKSMIYAGVKSDDPRVKAAVKWIGRHYDLASNPGMGQAGLYYYYHTLAKALDAAGMEQLVDAEGNRHDWRRELLAELLKRQRPDGSWVNENARWLEGEPSLVTGYVLLTLSYCKPAADKE
ncbi:MAG: terpene cyclase/mutase family protein [Planctomycetes bacterium]|nr:terpene cyclase/mutase family protein [Planctomycetota bacterium]MCG2685477.1 terpene cyclase/mutase family protein [Planctomycetales bacterium]